MVYSYIYSKDFPLLLWVCEKMILLIDISIYIPLILSSSVILTLKKILFYLIYSSIYPCIFQSPVSFKHEWNCFLFWSIRLSTPAVLYSLFLPSMDVLIFRSDLFIYLPNRFSSSAIRAKKKLFFYLIYQTIFPWDFPPLFF